MNKKNLLWLISLVIFSLPLNKAWTQDIYEAAYSYINTYPDDSQPGWHDNCQGITHDEFHWFITRDVKLYKIPVQHDLSMHIGTNPNILSIPISSIADLDGYNHFGDLAHYHFNGHHYLIIPVSGMDPPVIAVFESVDTPENALVPCLKSSVAKNGKITF